MATRPGPPDAPDKLAALNKILETAVQLTKQVASDPLFLHLVQAFARMPPEDRKTIVSVIEHEIEHRAVNVRTSGITGYTLVPNPNAQLYFRVYDSQVDLTADRDRDDMMLAILRVMRATPLMLAPHVYSEWRPAMREVSEHLTDEERDAARRVLSELLALLCREEDPADRVVAAK